jgi:hypothetical protein
MRTITPSLSTDVRPDLSLTNAGKFAFGLLKPPLVTDHPKSDPYPGIRTFAPPKDILLTPRTVVGSMLVSITREMELSLITNSG